VKAASINNGVMLAGPIANGGGGINRNGVMAKMKISGVCGSLYQLMYENKYQPGKENIIARK
jgi:hypothetical protein